MKQEFYEFLAFHSISSVYQWNTNIYREFRQGAINCSVQFPTKLQEVNGVGEGAGTNPLKFYQNINVNGNNRSIKWWRSTWITVGMCIFNKSKQVACNDCLLQKKKTKLMIWKNFWKTILRDGEALKHSPAID